jgi:hypothetical protein
VASSPGEASHLQPCSVQWSFAFPEATLVIKLCHSWVIITLKPPIKRFETIPGASIRGAVFDHRSVGIDLGAGAVGVDYYSPGAGPQKDGLPSRTEEIRT